jgi:hypothetical protein
MGGKKNFAPIFFIVEEIYPKNIRYLNAIKQICDFFNIRLFYHLKTVTPPDFLVTSPLKSVAIIS